jgi:nuclear mRNA export protein SAC3
MMVKKFRRSAAGVDEQLPSDLRTPKALKMSTDYLIDRIVGGRQPFASVHKFVWDRTRAIRNDITILQFTSPADVKIAIYCLERIARFHILALHQLSQNEEFDAHQEREQLNSTLVSLRNLYDDHRSTYVSPQEAEFRAYSILLDSSPSLEDRVQAWPRHLLKDARIKMALELYAKKSNAVDGQGPLAPRASFNIAQEDYGGYLRIVKSDGVSYLEACVAEMFFNEIREGTLRHILSAYKRRGNPDKALTLQDLMYRLGCENEEETREFAETHGFTIGNAFGEEWINMMGSEYTPDQSHGRRQAFSDSIVEFKRHNRTFPEVIHGVRVVDSFQYRSQVHNANLMETSIKDKYDSPSSLLGGSEPTPTASSSSQPPNNPFIQAGPSLNLKANPFDLKSNPLGGPGQTSGATFGVPTTTSNPFQPLSNTTQAPGGQITSATFGVPSNPFQPTPFTSNTSGNQNSGGITGTAPFQNPFQTSISLGVATDTANLTTIPFGPTNSSSTPSSPSRRKHVQFIEPSSQIRGVPAVAEEQEEETERQREIARLEELARVEARPTAQPPTATSLLASSQMPKSNPFNQSMPRQPSSTPQPFSSGVLAQTGSILSVPPTSVLNGATPISTQNQPPTFKFGQPPVPAPPQTAGILNNASSASPQKEPPKFDCAGRTAQPTILNPPTTAPAQNHLIPPRQPPRPTTFPPVQSAASFHPSVPPSRSPSRSPAEIKKQQQERALHQTVQTFFLQRSGILEQFIENEAAPIIKDTMRDLEEKRAQKAATEAHERYLAQKYCDLWKKKAYVLFRKRTSKGFRERMKKFREMGMQQSKEDIARRKATKKLENGIEEHHVRLGSHTPDHMTYFQTSPPGGVSSEPSRKRKSVISEQVRMMNAVRDAFNPNGSRSHKRSKTMSHATDHEKLMEESGEFERMPNGSLSRKVHNPYRQTQKVNWTKTDYFTCKALGIDPNTPMIPPSCKSLDKKQKRRVRPDGEDYASGTNKFQKLSSHERRRFDHILADTDDENGFSLGNLPTSASPKERKPWNIEDEPILMESRRLQAALAEDEARMRAERRTLEKEQDGRSTAKKYQHPKTPNGDGSSSSRPPVPSISRTEQRIARTGAHGLAYKPVQWNKPSPATRSYGQLSYEDDMVYEEEDSGSEGETGEASQGASAAQTPATGDGTSADNAFCLDSD